jgi:type VI secretion system protein ImpE
MQIQNPSTTQSLAEQVAAAMDAVRAAPQAPAARMALFRLDCVCGNWARARAQLDTLSHLDAEAAAYIAHGLGLLAAEAERDAVFAGRTPPIAIGEPPEWLAMMVRALGHDAAGEAEAAAALRRRALEAAPACAGTADGIDFTWIMDADLRLGPVLEVMTGGNYRWLPFIHLKSLRARPPETLRDLVWQPVELTLTNGGRLDAVVPVRYPDSHAHPDDAVRLARLTAWTGPDDAQVGHGQRLLAIDTSDLPLLDIRKLDLAPAWNGAGV